MRVPPVCILSLTLPLVSSLTSSTTWYLTSAPQTEQWISVATDTTGRYLVAATNGQGIYISSTYGYVWQVTAAPNEDWASVCSDSTGKYYAAAVVAYGGIYTSKNNGTTWELSNAIDNEWIEIVSNGSGQFLAAIGYSGTQCAYSSNDYGTTWTQISFPFNSCTSVAIDNSGQYLAVGGTFVFISSDFGESWVKTSAPQELNGWDALAMNMDGQYLIAGSQTGVYTSKSFGSNWTKTSLPAVDVDSWSSVTSDYTGQFLAAVGVGSVYFSRNYGDTWSKSSTQSSTNFYTVVSNSTGGIYVTISSGGAGGIYSTDPNAYMFRPTATPTVAPSQATVINQINDSESFNSLVMSHGTPFYVIFIFAAAYLILGVMLVRLRDKASVKMASFSLMSVCADLTMIGYNLVSEVFYVVVLFESNDFLFRRLAFFIVAARCLNLAPAAFIILKVLGPLPYSIHYSALMDMTHISEQATVYSAVVFLMIFDSPVARYLPWLSTKFTRVSMGFPDSFVYKMCMTTRVLQSAISLVVQGLVLYRLNEDQLSFGGSALVLFVLYMIATVLALLILILTGCLRVKGFSSSDKDDRNSLVKPMINGDGDSSREAAIIMEMRMSDISESASSLNAAFGDQRDHHEVGGALQSRKQGQEPAVSSRGTDVVEVKAQVISLTNEMEALKRHHETSIRNLQEEHVALRLENIKLANDIVKLTETVADVLSRV